MKTLVQVGMVFERLTIVKFLGYYQHSTMWLCRCACGNEKTIRGSDMRSGRTKSCGCYNKERATKHGLSRHPVYRAYIDAKRRCTNKKSQHYHNYGGRGIEFRLGTFEEFAKRMLPSWVEGLTLDRKDNNGYYEYDNIRWVSQKEQCDNRRTTKPISFAGKSMSLTKWADEIGVTIGALRTRRREGWTIERMLTTKTGKYIRKDKQDAHRNEK